MPCVLVVDDDARIRTLLRKLLEEHGHRVVEAGDGNTALTLQKQKRAHVIIADLLMPGKGGLEMIIELKKRYPDTKIIAISGGGQPGTESYLGLASSFGAWACFSKPVPHKKLLRAVEKAVG